MKQARLQKTFVFGIGDMRDVSDFIADERGASCTF